MSAPSDSPPAHSSRFSPWAWPVLGLAFTLCFIRLAGLTSDCAVNVLHTDAWDFLTPLFRTEGPLACFLQQHGPHRQGLGGVFQWALYGLSGWDARWESWFIVGVLTATAVLLVGLSARLRGRLSPADALFPLIVMSPMHWETMLLAVNMSHSILPLSLIALLAWTRLRPPSTSRALISGALGVLCLFTGFGLCTAIAFSGLCLFQTIRPLTPVDRRDALITLSVLMIGFGLFFIRYTWSPAIPGWSFPVSAWWNYGTFASYMAASVLGLRETTVLALSLGAGLVLSAALVFARSFVQPSGERTPARDAIIQLFIGTGGVYIIMTAVGRLPAGIEAAFMWRYTTLTSCIVLGLSFFLLQPFPRLSPALRTATVAVATILALLAWGGFEPEKFSAVTAEGKRRWIQEYLHSRDITDANQRSHFWVYPPEMDQARFASRLDWLEKSGLSLFADCPKPPTDSSEARPTPTQ